jgi:hypothetical protein
MATTAVDASTIRTLDHAEAMAIATNRRYLADPSAWRRSRR